MAFSFFNKEKEAEEYFKRGICYAKGDGVEKDLKKSVKWYIKAAEMRHAGAKFTLGFYFDAEFAGSERAVEWVTKAAEQGFAEAQYTLGRIYAEEMGVENNWEKAVEWFTKAAEQGYAEAQHTLGRLYAEGMGVKKDWVKAAAWLMKAAEQGYAEAQNHLGECYVCGKGVEKDWKKAAMWFMKAAEQNNESGMCNLGFCYYEGDGVIKDVEKAKKIWDTIDESLCCKMAVYYGERAYLERNYPKAYRILDLGLVSVGMYTGKTELIYLLKGKVYAKFEKYDSALAYLDKAIEYTSSEDASNRDNLEMLNISITKFGKILDRRNTLNTPVIKFDKIGREMRFDRDMTEALREETYMPYLIEALREKANILRSLKQIKEARKTLKTALESAITHNQSSMIAEVENELKVLPPDEDTLNNVTYLSAETIIQGSIGVYAKDDAIVNRPVVGEKGYDDPKNIYCPYCGRKLPVDARFCMGCGKQLEEGD